MTDLTTPSLLDALLDEIAGRVLAKLRINGTSDLLFSEAAIQELITKSSFTDAVESIAQSSIERYMENEFDIGDAVKEAIDDLSFDITVS